MASFTIALHHLRFFAEHGVYAEEMKSGNEFEVNISIRIKAPKEKLLSLKQTVNYAEVYRLTKAIFAKKSLLLETLAIEIADTIKEEFQPVRKVAIQIVKLHPPITGYSGSVSVTYKKAFR